MNLDCRQLSMLIVLVILFSTNLLQPLTASQSTTGDGQLEKLAAVTRTYGYVRFFHPSDQASMVDWDLMSLFVAEQALNSPQDESIDKLLQRIFGPLVEGLEIYNGPEKPQPEFSDSDADQVLAWQHIGVGLGLGNPLYASARNGRQNQVDVPADPFGNLMQSINPGEFLNNEIRMRFKACILSGSGRLQGWMRVDRKSQERGFFDNMGDRPIRSKHWQEYKIQGKVDEDAAALTFGVMFMGNGMALVDDVVLERKDGLQWQELDINNADFEAAKNSPKNWITRGKGYRFKIETDKVAEGKQAMRFERSRIKRGGIMEEVPRLGEVIDTLVAPGLRLRMPLALPVDTTYESGDSEETDNLMEKILQVLPGQSPQSTLCVANTIILWNVFQHFYPYFEQVDTDWDATLQKGLVRALESSSRQETTDTLNWLVAQLHDGHGMVLDPMASANKRLLPVRFDWIENQLVIIASDNKHVEVGDIVTHIDGIESETYLQTNEELISGSPQWKRVRSLQNLQRGEEGAVAKLSILRNDQELTVDVEFTRQQPVVKQQREVIELLVDGDTDQDDIYYVDLNRAEPGNLKPKLEAFARAKGIVFDLRGYPRGTQFLLQHMTDEHMQSQKWQVPRQLRPNRVDMREIETMNRWQLPPQQPRFEGRIVFLTNASAISYAESVMSIVANYKLGEIIGSPTAGANGNINPFPLPGGFRVSWTGMRVMNHDDSQHHVRGVQPTVPLQPTIAGVTEGRDEYVEKALELIEGG